VRIRVTAPRAVDAVERLLALASQRPVLARGLDNLSRFLRDRPADDTSFPLLEVARVIHPGHADPIAAFREFRRSVGGLASQEGIDLAIVVDGHKQLDAALRTCWFEGSDDTDDRLTKLSAHAASSEAGGIAAYGRLERDGKLLVRVLYDVAPADWAACEPLVEELQVRLSTDAEYLFERVPTVPLGDGGEPARRSKLASADLVVAFLSPSYLAWTASLEPASRVEPGGVPVAPIHWLRLGRRADLGAFRGLTLFPRGGDLDRSVCLASLRGTRRTEALADLHRELVRLVGAPASWPVETLARVLATADEERVIARAGVRTALHKGAGVAASGPATATVDVQKHLMEWATSPDSRPYFVVFGEYGMGKTVAAQTLTHELLGRRHGGEAVPLPVYLDLRRLSRAVRSRDASLPELLDDLIGRVWQGGWDRPLVGAREVIEAVQQRGALVIFDGLDEVLVHLNEHEGQNLLRELLRILPPGMASGPGRRPEAGRILLTCRTHFFRTLREQHTFFRGEDRDGMEPDLYEALHLLPFDESQIRAYLSTRRGLESVDRAVGLIRSVRDLADLAGRPYNLRLIAEQIDRLEQRVASGQRIDAASLYEDLIQSWLDRDSGKHQLERPHKVRLMEDLAAHLWRNGLRQLEVSELETWLRERFFEDPDLSRWVALARPDPSVLAEDVRTATFIVRPGTDSFAFAHTSLLEYFLARFLYRELRAGNLDAWALAAPSRETIDFLVELVRAGDAGRCVAHLRICGRAYRPLVSELVVRYACRAAELGEAALSLAGFELAGARLRGLPVSPAAGVALDMACCHLAGADLREARLEHVNLSNADLSGARLTRAELHACRLRAVTLAGASLEGAIFRGCHLDGIHLGGAIGQDSQWMWCLGMEPVRSLQGCLVAPRLDGPEGMDPSRATLEVLARHTAPVSALAWSPQGSELASGDAAGAVCTWNAVSGTQTSS
jgi:NACHT domain-containing protein/pentapeptide repeat protein